MPGSPLTCKFSLRLTSSSALPFLLLQLSCVDTWLTEWGASEDQSRALFKQLAGILKANGKR